MEYSIYSFIIILTMIAIIALFALVKRILELVWKISRDPAHNPETDLRIRKK